MGASRGGLPRPRRRARASELPPACAPPLRRTHSRRQRPRGTPSGPSRDLLSAAWGPMSRSGLAARPRFEPAARPTRRALAQPRREEAIERVSEQHGRAPVAAPPRTRRHRVRVAKAAARLEVERAVGAARLARVAARPLEQAGAVAAAGLQGGRRDDQPLHKARTARWQLMVAARRDDGGPGSDHLVERAEHIGDGQAGDLFNQAHREAGRCRLRPRTGCVGHGRSSCEGCGRQRSGGSAAAAAQRRPQRPMCALASRGSATGWGPQPHTGFALLHMLFFLKHLVLHERAESMHGAMDASR